VSRRLLNVVTLLSLLLCVAGAALWAQSYRASGSLPVELRGTKWEFVSYRGQLLLSNEPQRRAEARQWAAEQQSLLDELRRLGEQIVRSPPPRDPEDAQGVARQRLAALNELGARISFHATTPPATARAVRHTTSYRLAVSLAAILPALWTALSLRTWQRARQARLVGLCKHCGYDLRATPDRCPECGTDATP
jgi:hypothetical protein